MEQQHPSSSPIDGCCLLGLPVEQHHPSALPVDGPCPLNLPDNVSPSDIRPASSFSPGRNDNLMDIDGAETAGCIHLWFCGFVVM